MNRTPIVPKEFLLALLLALVPACDGGGTKTGNGITVQVRASSSVGPPLSSSGPVVAGATGSAASAASAGMELWAPDAQGTIFNFASIRAYVRDFEFELPDNENCDDYQAFPFVPPVSCNASRVRIDGPFVAELVNGTLYPFLAVVGIPPGAYTHAETRLDLANPADGVILSGDPLVDYTILGSGSFTYQTVPRTFDFALSFAGIAGFDNDLGIPVTGASVDPVVFDMDVALWFTGLNITQCLDSGELTFTVGTHLHLTDSGQPAGDCKAIESDLENAILASTKLDEDP